VKEARNPRKIDAFGNIIDGAAPSKAIEALAA
jgi:hypothetical protein